ncbi:MAG: MFS transporter [Alphaproteobacteria bacterium]|nr:MFS transporter [Alphaproteobacteria bacterium]
MSNASATAIVNGAKPRGRNALAFIFITVLINMTGFGVIVPVMPDLIMDVTGKDLAYAARWGGIMSAVYAIMQFVMGPVLGALSDRFGRRPVILGSLVAYSLDFLLLAAAPSLAVLLAARIMSGAFAATFTTANAYIADISPPEKRAANFGLMGAAFGLGFIIGPMVGGLVGEAYGVRAPFYFVAGLGLINFIYGSIFLPETLSRSNRRAFDWRRANMFGSFIQFRKYPEILPIALSVFLFQIGHWSFPSVWAYYSGEKFDWSPREIAYSLTAVGLAAAIVQGGLTRVITPRLGERGTAFMSLSVATLVYGLYGAIQEGWMVYMLIPVGAFAGLTLPSLQGIMSRTVPPDAQGELQGAIAGIAGLSMIIGPYAMTQVFAAFVAPGTPVGIGPFAIAPNGAPFYMPGAPFFLASLLAASALVTLWYAVRANPPTPKQAPADHEGLSRSAEPEPFGNLKQ